MAEEKPEKAEEKKPSKGLNPLLVIGCGCLILLVLLGVVLSVAGGFIAKKAGISFLQGLIQQKTGITTNLGDIEKGKLSFTDTKTGAKVDVGSGKIPDSFPKDFPVYPGAKVTAVLSGSEKGEGSGFWLTMSTPDAMDKVAAFYKTELAKNKWEVTANYSTGVMATQAVKKGKYAGSVSVNREEDAKETTLVIVLEEQKSETSPSAAAETPAEETPVE